MISGYPDGAKIIWRSLYEHAVILLVLALENDNELADKYFYHSVRGSKKKLESYAKHHLKLNFPPVDPNYEKLVNAEVETMIKKFGNKFLENDYGWADNLFLVIVNELNANLKFLCKLFDNLQLSFRKFD
ncbi:MAG: hypothetical protein IPL22_21400 [Bacteroidetes bacterium]|nr:hypothetical protein [Bacteroidota bacterium]